MKLDTSRPYGVFFDGPNSWYGQDGRLFDKRTFEEVIRNPAPPPVSEPPKPQEPDKATCEKCGKAFTLPAGPKGRQLALGRLRAHLAREHGITVEKTP